MASKFGRMVIGQTLVVVPDIDTNICLLPPLNAVDGDTWGATLHQDHDGWVIFDTDPYGGPPDLSDYGLRAQDDSIWFYLANGRVKIYGKSIQPNGGPPNFAPTLYLNLTTANPVSQSLAPTLELLFTATQPPIVDLAPILEFALSASYDVTGNLGQPVGSPAIEISFTAPTGTQTTNFDPSGLPGLVQYALDDGETY